MAIRAYRQHHNRQIPRRPYHHRYLHCTPLCSLPRNHLSNQPLSLILFQQWFLPVNRPDSQLNDPVDNPLEFPPFNLLNSLSDYRHLNHPEFLRDSHRFNRQSNHHNILPLFHRSNLLSAQQYSHPLDLQQDPRETQLFSLRLHHYQCRRIDLRSSQLHSLLYSLSICQHVSLH